MFETLNIEAGTITGMGEPEIPEEFIQIAEQFENEVEINDEARS